MRVLVTGHAGFIGRNLCAHLRDRGDEVYGVDVASPLPPERVDIRDREGLKRTFARAKPEAVVHLAALASVPGCEARPGYAMDVNERGTRIAAQLAARHGSRFVFMSSAAVYGNPSRLPTPTEAPQRPVNVYGETKVRGERIVREELEGDAVIFRLFNAYGERCDRSYVIPDVIRKALAGLDPLPMQGLGSEARDFVYVRDVVAALDCALRGDAAGTYNLGTGRSTDIRTVAGLVLRALGMQSIGLRFEDVSRVGDFRVSWADLSDGNRLPDWAPRWSLEAGIRNTVGYYAATMGRTLAAGRPGDVLVERAATPPSPSPGVPRASVRLLPRSGGPTVRRGATR